MRLLEGYRGYVMTGDYAGYNALTLQPGVEPLARMTHAPRKFVNVQKVQRKVKTGRADSELVTINKLYGIDGQLRDVRDDRDLKPFKKRACRFWRNCKAGWIKPNHRLRGKAHRARMCFT